MFSIYKHCCSDSFDIQMPSAGYLAGPHFLTGCNQSYCTWDFDIKGMPRSKVYVNQAS